MTKRKIVFGLFFILYIIKTSSLQVQAQKNNIGASTVSTWIENNPKNIDEEIIILHSSQSIAKANMNLDKPCTWFMKTKYVEKQKNPSQELLASLDEVRAMCVEEKNPERAVAYLKSAAQSWKKVFPRIRDPLGESLVLETLNAAQRGQPITTSKMMDEVEKERPEEIKKICKNQNVPRNIDAVYDWLVIAGKSCTSENK